MSRRKAPAKAMSARARAALVPACATAIGLACSPLLKSKEGTFAEQRMSADGGTSLNVRPLAYLKAPSPAESAWLGYTAALDGERPGVLATAPQGDVTGETYLFEPDSKNDWRPRRIVPATAGEGDGVVPDITFPSDVPRTHVPWGSMRVALSPTLVVIGVGGEDSAARPGDLGATDSGAVYVYSRDALDAPRDYLKAPHPEQNALYGFGVALSGSRLAVGAPLDQGSGVVYVYDEKDGHFGAPSFVVMPENPDEGDMFGESVALEGNVMVVGAPLEDGSSTGVGGDMSDNQTPACGATYVFRLANGAWKQEAYIKPNVAADLSFFGLSVGLSGNTVAASAPGASNCGGANDPSGAVRGSVYIASDRASGWTVDQCLGPDSGALGVDFGWSLDVSGARLAVGAPFDPSGNRDPTDTSKSFSGAAYLYEQRQGAWSETAYIKAPNPDANDLFGYQVRLGKGLFLAGAPREWGGQSGPRADLNDNSVAESGAAYVFTVSEE